MLEGRVLLAHTFLVTRLTDTGASTGPFAGDLRYCITHAQAGDTIAFDKSLSGSSATVVNLTTVGDTTFGPSAFRISKAITIDGGAVRNLIIERATTAGTPDFRIFEVAPQGSLTLEHLTVSNGVARDDGQPGATPGSTDAQGGGILDAGGSVTLLDATVADNSAQGGTGRDAQGGGLFAAGGSISLTNVTITGNSANGGLGERADVGGPGGSAEGGGLDLKGGVATLSGVTIANNSAIGGDGGRSPAVPGGGGQTGSVGGPGGGADGGGLSLTGGVATLSGVTIANNAALGGSGGISYSDGPAGTGGAARGGGLYETGTSGALTDGTVADNRAMGGFGGWDFGRALVVGGAGQGGGLFLDSVRTALVHEVIAHNTAEGGAVIGAYSFAYGGGFGGAGQGGGLYVNALPDRVPTLTDDAIVDNKATGGRGVGVGATGPLDFIPGGGGVGQGGGLYAGVLETRVALLRVIVSGNAASGAYGGGGGGDGGAGQGGGVVIAASGSSTGPAGATLTDDTLSNNAAHGGDGGPGGGGKADFGAGFGGSGQGGALYAFRANITLAGGTIAGNSAKGGTGNDAYVSTPGGSGQGGGVYLGANGVVSSTLTNVRIADNIALAGPRGQHGGAGEIGEEGVAEGGGLYASASEGQTTLVNVTLAGNTAGSSQALQTGLGNSRGGGLFVTGGRATLIDDTISGNAVIGGLAFIYHRYLAATSRGGGLFADRANLTLANVTVAANSAFGGKVDASWIGTAQGGGLAIIATEGARATLTNVTVANNSVLGSSVRGGGLDAAGTVTLNNTLVAQNTQTLGRRPTAPSDIGGTVAPASASNLIGTGGAGGLVGDVKQNQVDVADPLLGPLTYNGGPTQTLALLAGSPALNAGDNALATAAGLTTDQRGLPRMVDGRVDVGAFEKQPPLAGPSVTGVERFGYHARPTTLVLHFNQALDPASATNPANYRLTLRGRHHSIRITAATYDAAAMTVTLHPAVRLPLRGSYVLTITGTPPHGLKNTYGQFLQGAGSGQPGTDFTTTITRKNLLLDPRPYVVAVGSGPRQRPETGTGRTY